MGSVVPSGSVVSSLSLSLPLSEASSVSGPQGSQFPDWVI